MYELVKINENDFYIDSPSKIGIVKTGKGVCLIDSGNDKNAAKKVARVLDESFGAPISIYNTHSHADHIGGNRYLSEKYGCEIFARGIERDFTEHTILQPMFLFGGFPTEELCGKFMIAEPSSAHPFTSENECGMKVIELPGHSFEMVGFLTENKTAYIADALSSREILDKYGIGYIYDVERYLETLEYIKTIDAKLFVPSHAAPTDDIAPLADYNAESVGKIADKICEICHAPLRFEDILTKLFDAFSLRLTFEQYALIGSTLRSYLSYLKKKGRISAVIDSNALLWQAM